MDKPNYITPQGFAALQARYHALFAEERPKLVETVSWAAGNGDRSENGDYIYGKKRLREIDRELGWLSRRIKAARVVDPAAQPDKSVVLFGATVTLADEDDHHRTITIVGDDEADAACGLVGWNAPIARAVRGARVGDVRRLTLPAGVIEYEVMAISYP
ncbi:MAG: GreA/GreB family elongation factor [Alphaproteobacteria bacterium]|nr:GreA/GreB family elongation factor [Alphaproteobacteria bacterium]